MDFYERVESLRKKRGLSQGELEKELGFSNGSISKWKKSFPTHDRLQKLSDYFGVSIDYLKDGKEKEYNFNPESAHLVAKLRQDKELAKALEKYFAMPEDKKKHVIDTINML